VSALADHFGRQRLAPVLADFCSEMQRRGALLDAALVDADWPAVDALTHSIKGSALTFGAAALGACARSASDAARVGKAGETSAQVRQLLQLIAPTCAAMRAHAAYGKGSGP
jgi:HPt (histidine-containing phosphotransfer) domain-containing protein